MGENDAFLNPRTLVALRCAKMYIVLVRSMMGLPMIKSRVSVSALVLFGSVGLGSVALLGLGNVSPAQANEYQSCSARLTEVKLDRLSIAQGCAEALHPADVGTCVVRIVNNQSVNNKIVNLDALDACRRVRRPLELATCVTMIHQSTETMPLSNDASKMVLDSCRKSLLPERYGRCVVGFRNNPLQKTIVDVAMTDRTKELDRTQELDGLNTCLDATDYRKDIKLIPLSEVIGPASPAPTMTNPPYTSPIMPTPMPTPTPQIIPQQF